MSLALENKWLEAFGLKQRRRPDLFQHGDPIDDSPHAMALRIAFEKLELSTVFCIEGVPTIGFLVLDRDEPNRIEAVHRALWNQGLMSLLLVISEDTVRAFSLARMPSRDALDEDRCLVTVLQRVGDALELREIVLGIESGRWWNDHQEYFDATERIDEVLLDNLISSSKKLQEATLDNDSAQALLMQTMFICYLEDREIVLPNYIKDATNSQIGSFVGILRNGDASKLEALFSALNRDFNGDIFIAPCTFDPKASPLQVTSTHMRVLVRFREGKEVMETGQGRFWGYDFRYIPVELLSAVYDRFLAEHEKRRQEGAYYTPMFLADTVAAQASEVLNSIAERELQVLDPACGSGIFLVRTFQRIVENNRRKISGDELPWNQLVGISEQLHGNDINENALRVTLFSIYLALLEQVSPPDIRALMAQGKMLPRLWGQTLKPESFFERSDDIRFELIIGNPPWSSRRSDVGGALGWCESRSIQLPSNEISWAFVWKASMLLANSGICVLLLPAMGILLNQSKKSLDARALLFRKNKVRRVINLSDLVSQLFPSAKRPASIVVFERSIDSKNYRFEYWCPKADLNLRQKRSILLSNQDRTKLRSDQIVKEAGIFKRKMWMRSPDERLLAYLQSLPSLGDIIDEYRLVSRGRSSRFGWIVGQGFKPVNPERLGDENYETHPSGTIKEYPFLDADLVQPLYLPKITAPNFDDSIVHRTGFQDGFKGPHIIIPQGIIRDEGHLRAAYTDQSLSFEHSLQAIVFPDGDELWAKLLTVILNSRLTAWFLFHTAANMGTERAKVLQKELLTIPFAKPQDMPEPEVALRTAKRIGSRFDKLRRDASSLLSAPPEVRQFDRDVYKYFGLSEDEATVVEDTYEYIIPAMQPTIHDYPSLWKPASAKLRGEYASTLSRALKSWLNQGMNLSVRLVGIGSDLAILSLQLTDEPSVEVYAEPQRLPELIKELDQIWANLPRGLPGNFQAIPDLRIFIDDRLYLVKPLQSRHWHRSTALADADGIAAELSRALTNRNNRRQIA